MVVFVLVSSRKVAINKRFQKTFFTDNIQKNSYLNVRKIIKDLNINIKFKIINIIGTNGKGSIAHYLAEALIKNQYKVGLFTSPHLISLTERIKINNHNINKKDFINIKKTLPNLAFFDCLYLIAIIYFVNNKVDIAIIEAGIGGNEDTTKALQGSIGIVASIGLDHQDILGDTLEKIANDKAGIINAKMHFYIPNSMPQKLQNIFISKSKKPFIVNNKAQNFVQENMILASEVLKNEFNIKYQNFSNLPGRIDIRIIDKQLHIFDGAHNFDAIKASLKFLYKQNIDFDNVVICMQKKKNKTGIIDLFKQKNVFYFQLDNNFHSFKKIKKIKFKNFKKLMGNTLFIGSFYFIGYLYEKNNISF